MWEREDYFGPEYFFFCRRSLALNSCVVWSWIFFSQDHVFKNKTKHVYYISIDTAVGTRPWTNRFTSTSTTIVSSSSHSHMVDPDWIHILGKQRLPCVKGKVTVYVSYQCSENRCFWRVSGSVFCSLVHSFIPQYINVSCIQ